MDVGSITTFFVSLDSADVAAVLTLEAGEATPTRIPLEEEKERPQRVSLEEEEERPTSIKSK